MKMAIQYWHALGKTKKNKMLSLRGGYHGDTFAAMSVCDPITGMHHRFNNALTEQHFCERPTCKFSEPFSSESTHNLRRNLETNHQEIAALILEPVVQGAGGMWFYHPQYLKEVRRLCDQYNVLLIADEIATGFGRTGKFFACEWADIAPDILCLGKALTGGYISLAATLTTAKVAKGISANGGVFMHGPTFMGNPLACAIAIASIDVLLANDWTKSVSAIENTMREELSPASLLRNVENVRILGAIGVIEMKSEIDLIDSQAYFVERGVWVRPFGKLLYIMPPYIISTEDLSKVCRTMVDYARSLETR